MKQATARAAANWRRVYAMPVASIYPSYIAKAEKKGRTRADVDQVILWLTGYTPARFEALLAAKTDFQTFFADAPALNPARLQVTGLICGIRVDAMEPGLMQEIRYLDKLIDELAKGRAMDKILRA